MMEVKFESKSKRRKDDVVNLLILLFIASLLGVYAITTTILIAQDGIYYIQQAQKFSSNPTDVVKLHPPGYPFLIFIAHKFVSLFSNSPSALTWIYSAQSITLLCRLFAIVPLYFIGKLLVGSRNSFWALLILISLPYPSEFGSDVLRDWPHILFLAMGFSFLLFGAMEGKWWMFGIVGFTSGLGHIIRPECAQLVIYGLLWLLVGLLLPKHNMNRPRLVCSVFVLLVGFAVPVMPYMIARGQILPVRLKNLVTSSELQSDKIQQRNIADYNGAYTAAGAGVPGNIAKALGRLIGEISDDLFYYFVPALVIGIYSHFRRKSTTIDVERFFIFAFVLLNILMMILLYCFSQYISRRHCLPLIVFLIFYVPEGLETLAGWLRSRSSKSRLETSWHPQLCFFILLVTGVGICLPKLFRPIRVDKQGYRAAAKWLRENSKQEDTVAVPDMRISFYAERKGLMYSKEIPKQAKYVVRIVKSKNEEQDFDRTAQKEYSVRVDKRKRSEKRLVIYRNL